MFSATDAPAIVTIADPDPVELGVRFVPWNNGAIRGIRFYKGPQNVGIHIAHLWTATGSMLGSATFTGETASGWQTVLFPQAIAVTARTGYVASYHTNGYYSANPNFFTTARINAPLTAPSTSESGGNGLYAYGASAFPTESFRATNYWVDVLFAADPATGPPAIIGTLTANASVGLPFSYQIMSSNGATGFSASTLPAGLSINATTGMISGTPTTAGSYNIGITATNALGTGGATVVLTISTRPTINASGLWSPEVVLPLVPTSGAILPNGKALLWAADGEFSFAPEGSVSTTLVDPNTNTSTATRFQGGHNMFCTGTTNMADGRIFANGGSQELATTIYDPATNQTARVQDMNVMRGYNSNTILPDGSVLTIGGSWSGGLADKKSEVWTAGRGWRMLDGVSTVPMTPPNLTDVTRDSHMWLMPAGNGRVFFAGPSEAMQWIDVDGAGSVVPAGRRGDDTFSVLGAAVMYDKGHILKVGGALAGQGFSSSSAYRIDLSNGVSVNKLVPMSYPRMYANSVVLPDGNVFVVGGQTFGRQFYDTDAVMPTELWNSLTGAFTVTAPITTPRNYHSIALLLADGRVLSAGGGLCGVSCSSNHPDYQIYSPGYLFDAQGNLKTRPAIIDAPTTLQYSRTISVTTDKEITAFSLVRLGSTTHTVNNDQRRLPLTFVQTRALPGGAYAYTVDIPSNPGWLLPGYWMLFAIDASGTPSVSKIVRVELNTVANLSADQVTNIPLGVAASIHPRISRIDPAATLSINGLPPGLFFNSSTGAITGAPTAPGNFSVTLSASDGSRSVSTEFVIAVDPPVINSGTGLLADYFATPNLDGPIASSRVEAPWFADNTVGAAAGVDAASFSARWSGAIVAQRTGTTTIRTRSDDGVRVWIGGRMVIDNWAPHTTTVNEGEIDFVAGAHYRVYIEYHNGSGGNALQLSWRRPGDTNFTGVATSQLYPALPLGESNLALGRPAIQSSNASTSTGPALAVDGNTNGDSTVGAVAQTESEENAFWQVDLGASVEINRIRIWNRTDCCSDRLQDFHVLISDHDMSGKSFMRLLADPTVQHRSVATSSIPSNIAVQGGAAGRFVRIQLAGTNALQLAEVEVFGEQPNQSPLLSGLPSTLSLLFGEPVSRQVTATDPENQPVLISAANLPAGVAISPLGVISGAPTSLGSGTATIVATDASGLSSSTQLPWRVVSGLPFVTRLSVSPAPVGSTVVYYPTIANGDAATYRWDFGDGAAPTELSATPSASHIFTTAGVRTVTLTLRAATGAQTTYSFNQAVYSPVAGSERSRSSSGSAYETRTNGGPRLWIANPDNDSVGVIDLTTFKLASEIPVGAHPVNVAIHPNGDAWVINRDSATISIVDPATLAVKQTASLPRASRPYGIVFSGRTAFVTLEASESLARVTESGVVTGTAHIGPSPRHLAMNATGDGLLVSRFITQPLPGESTATVRTTDAAGNPVGGEVVEVDTSGATLRTFVLKHSDVLDTEVSARGVPNYLGAPAIAPDGDTAWIPSKQDNLKRGMLRDGRNLDFQSSVRAIVSKIDLRTGLEETASRIDLDNSGVASAALFHPSGAYLFVALQTSREIAVVDPVGAREIFRFKVGRAPVGLVLSPDGETLYTINFMDRSVTRVDLWRLLRRGLNEVSGRTTIRTILSERLTAKVLRGKQLFYDAADPRLARDGYLSCAACHDNAEHDGRVWDFTGFGEGLRNTISIEGHAGVGHGFLHWSANFDEAQDFEAQIRNFAQGTGLMSDTVFNAGTHAQPLGDKKARMSSDLDALAAYLASRTKFPDSPWRNLDGALTPEAQAGKTAFSQKGCATCHAGVKMTISGDATRLRDIGTIKPTSGRRLGATLTGIDVPTLLGVFATAPYLHDGSALTLDAAIQAHGSTALTALERANMASYLRQIGGTP